MTSNSENLLNYIKRCNYYHMIVIETTAYPNLAYRITEDDAGPIHHWYTTKTDPGPSHYWYTTKSVVWPNIYNGGN